MNYLYENKYEIAQTMNVDIEADHAVDAGTVFVVSHVGYDQVYLKPVNSGTLPNGDKFLCVSLNMLNFAFKESNK